MSTTLSELLSSGYLRNINKNTKDILQPIVDTCSLYYLYKPFVIDTNSKYTIWSDLECTEEDLEALKLLYSNIMNLNLINDQTSALPIYEMYRLYFTTYKDVNMCTNKWKAAHNIWNTVSEVNNVRIRKAFKALYKSCTLAGYDNTNNEGIITDESSPVFILNYSKFNWSDFDDDLNDLIAASFYLTSWMTDDINSIQNGVILMIDTKGIQFGHLTKIFKFLSTVQKSLCLKTKSIYITGLPYFIDYPCRAFLKLFPKKLQNKMHFCASTDELCQSHKIEKIPQCFGGKLNENNWQNIPQLDVILTSYLEVKSFDYFE